MRLYRLSTVPQAHRKFAICYVADKVEWANENEVCEACHEPVHRRRLGPYGILWQPGSDVIPDFSTFCDLIVTQRVKDTLDSACLRGYTAWPVRILEPKKRARTDFPIVPSPYAGPPLWDIYVDPTESVRYVPGESTIEYRGPCQKCGAEQWRLPDIDVEEQHFIVDRESWHGQDFMLPMGIGMLVTQNVVDALRDKDFTNLSIREVGRISD